MNMSDVEGSADQDCRVHHKSGGYQEVRRSHHNFWQVNQIEEVTPDWNWTPTTRLKFPLLLSWSWMLKEGNFSFFGWTQFVRLLFLVFSQLYVQKSFKLSEVRIWSIVRKMLSTESLMWSQTLWCLAPCNTSTICMSTGQSELLLLTSSHSLECLTRQPRGRQFESGIQTWGP